MNGDNISVLVLFIGWGGFDRRTTIVLYFWLIIRRLHSPHNCFVDLSSLSHFDFQNWKCEAIGHFNLLTLFCRFIMGWKPSSCHPFVMIEHYNYGGTTFASCILRLNWNLFVPPLSDCSWPSKGLVTVEKLYPESRSKNKQPVEHASSRISRKVMILQGIESHGKLC